MTSLASSYARPLTSSGVARHIPAVLCALLAGLLLSWGRVETVWHFGAFFDPDDAMRTVQIRDLLAGQSWFDMTAYRLDPPAGVFSHWSRVVDLPMVLLIRAFELGLPPVLAERLARIVFPLLLQGCLLLALARLATLLMGPRAGAPAIVLGLLSGIVFGQFQPGRIDHHALQIVLLVACLGSLVAALSPTRTREAAAAAAFAAVSLAVSLENLPFVLALVAALVALWIVRGHVATGPMRAFAAGLALALPLCFVATIGPARWTLGAADAFSATQLVAGLAGAVVLAVLPALTDRPEAVARRLAFAGIGAGIVLAVTALLAPAGLHEPFVGMDPLVRELWLKNVTEVYSLARMTREAPLSAATFAGPLLLGAAGVAAACWGTEGAARLRWLFVAAALAVGVALSFWAVRVLTFAGPLATLGGVAATLWLHDRLTAIGRSRLAALSVAAILPFSATGWALALSSAAPDESRSDKAACLAPTAYTPLAAISPGLIMAPIDLGAYLLAFTPHAAVAAPYHRNNAGNRTSLDIFLASPDRAEMLFAASGARYLVVCNGMSDMRAVPDQASEGLAMTLAEGRVPPWLRAIPLTGTPLRLFEAVR